jgi:hypothetical protein
MAKYLITYDLVGTSETSADYTRLIEQIKSYLTWGKVEKSVWVIKSGKSATTIRDELLAVADSNDRLFVVQLGGAGAWQNAICEDSWLRTFLETD